MRYKLKLNSFTLPLVLGTILGILASNFALGVAIFSITILPAFVKLYIPYALDNPKKFWFKRKLYGWGWTPVTWQGWTITLLYVGLVMLFAATLDANSDTKEKVFMFGLPFTFLTITFIRIAWLKGEKPKWQWGR